MLPRCKVLGQGTIRLQSYGGWMALKRIRVDHDLIEDMISADLDGG